MKSRRRQVIWVGLVVLLAFSVHWLASPATTSNRGGRESRTNLAQIVDWVQEKARSLGKEISDPPLAILPAPTLGPPGSIEVRVEDAAGGPLEAVRVTLLGPTGVPAQDDLITDADGLASWKGLPSAPGYVVRECSRGGALRSVEVTPTKSARVLLMHRPVRLEGTVVDSTTGKPVRGALVEWLSGILDDETLELEHAERLRSRGSQGPFPSGAQEDVVSGPDGRFAMDPRGARRGIVVASTPDGRLALQFAVVDAPVTVRVGPGRRIQGRIVDDAGKARAGMRVRGWPGTKGKPPDVTDAEGRFSVQVAQDDDVYGNTIDLEVEGEGVPRFRASTGRDESPRIVLPGQAGLELEVREAGSGAPLPDVTLHVQCGSLLARATTARDGKARIALSADAIRVLHVFVPGRGGHMLIAENVVSSEVQPGDALAVPLSIGERRSLVLRVSTATTRVTGRLVNAAGGGPATGIPVQFGSWDWGPTATSDESGDLLWLVSTTRTDGGALAFSATDEGWESFTGTSSALPLPSRLVDLGVLTRHRSAALRIRVLDAEGRPVPRASADLESRAVADENGQVVLPVPQRRFGSGDVLDYVTVSAPGFRRRQFRIPAPSKSCEVLDVEPVRLERVERRSMQVVEEGGRPVARCRVVRRDSSSPDTFTDAAGRVDVPGPESEWDGLDLFLPSGVTFSCWAGVTTDELRLPSTREVRVRVLDPLGAPIESASVYVFEASQKGDGDKVHLLAGFAGVDAAGIASRVHLAGVPLRVTARAPGFTPATIDLEPALSETVIVLRRRDAASLARLREAIAERDELARRARDLGPVFSDEREGSERRKERQEIGARQNALNDEIRRLRRDGWDGSDD